MCGIAGGIAIAAGARVDRDRVARMSELVSHRGPDGSGFWAPADLGDRVVLAHRRLSVIDIAGGAQPMEDVAQGLAIAFNGEIYDYREQREALEREGFTFATNSDTEVLLRMYERHGVACLHKLRGMFAFALWDRRRGALLIARDRMGKKPLFYAVERGCLYFASTLRALRETSAAPRKIDARALDAFLRLGYIPAPLTIETGFSKLAAGTLLWAGPTNLEAQRYWVAGGNGDGKIEEFTGDFTAAVDRTEELLTDAVALRLRSDVPLGVFLSGGIDSSLVAAIAARQLKEPLHTFSIGFGDSNADESPQAERVARHLGTTHQTFPADADLLELLPAMTCHFGEPFGDATTLAMALLAQHARQHVTVALSGDGGDEAFGGYEWYQTAEKLSRMHRLVGPRLAGGGASLVRRLFNGSARVRRVRKALELVAAGDGDRYGALRTFLPSGERADLYTDDFMTRLGGVSFPAAGWIADLYESAGGSALRRMRVVDFQTYLADCLMPKVDVPTMMWGLEARAPLLDQEVVNFALSLPDRLLAHPHGGKRVLRAVLARYVPESLVVRRKRGFSLPLERWLKPEMLETDEALLDTGWLDAGAIRRMVAEHVEGRRDHSQRLYNLIALREWLLKC